MMTMGERIFAAGAVLALLGVAACGGGAGGRAQQSLPAVSAAAKVATADFTISIPKGIAAQGAARRPQYISPNSRSASIALVSVNGIASTQSPTVVNLTPASPACSSTSGTLVCTVSVPAAAGSDVFSLTLYSAPSAAGSKLSTGTVTATIAAGSVNKVPLTLNGVVNTVSVTLSQTAPLANGTSTTIAVTVVAQDASGATIVGPGNYSPAITLTDSDTTGSTSLSATAVTKPGGAAITLSYDGSALIAGKTITIGATASGVPAANIVVASLSPISSASTTVSGATAFAVLSDPSGNVVAVLPTSAGALSVPVATSATTILSRLHKPSAATRKPAALPTPLPVLPISPAPDECAPDQVDHQLDCMSYSSNIISIISYNPANVLAALTLVGQIETDAPAAGVPFSGTAGCVACGIAYDPVDKAVIISTANGYELYNPSAASLSPTTVTAPVTTIAAPISENFGYNGNTNQIFSPYYVFAANPWTAPARNLDVINITGGTGTWYDLLPADTPAGLSEPDSGAVDTKTGIAVAPEEGSVPIYLQLIPAPGTAAFVPTTSPAAGAPGGTLNMTVTPVTPSSATYITNCEETYAAADSVEDLAFFGAEFCGTDYVAVGQLPTTATVPTGFSSYVDAQLPVLPTGSAFVSPYDPHAAVVINIPSFCADCGVLFNLDKSYVAIVDLNKLLALAPAASPNGYDVPSTTDLVASGVVQYIPTGVTSAPNAFLRARAAYRRSHPALRARIR